MPLAEWIRAAVWRAHDWCAALATLADGVAAEPNAERACELGLALELVDPDRKRALAMYMLAWRTDGRADALERARRLALEVRAHDTIAELAIATYERTSDPAHLTVAGVAWIDAGTPERAVEPLARAVLARPDADTRTLLAAAKAELRDPPGEISRAAARATRASRDDQARIYLHAARVANACKLDDLYQRFLQLAHNARPSDESAALIEDRLLARGKATELVELYRSRLETVKSDRDWVETVRATATKLVLHTTQVGFALRLLRHGLEHAYGAKLVDVPGHIASWELLLRHARKLKSTLELMPLIIEALGLPLRDDDRLYLAAAGFDVTWRDAGEVEAARSYAAAVAELVPDHPEVRAFMSKEMASLLSGNEDDDLLSALGIDEPVATRAAIEATHESTPGSTAAPNAEPEPVASPSMSGAEPASLPSVAEIDASPLMFAAESASLLSVAELDAPSSLPVAESASLLSVAELDAPSSLPVVKSAAPPAAELDAPSSLPVAEPAAPTEPVMPPSPPVVELDTSLPAALVPAPLPPPAERVADLAKPAARSAISLIPPAAMAALRGGKPMGVPARPAARIDAAPRAPRVVVPIDVVVELPGGTKFVGIARDLSTSGAFIVAKLEIATDAVVTLELHLPGADFLTQSRHRVSAQVVRCTDTGYGMTLLEPSAELFDAIAALVER